MATRRQQQKRQQQQQQDQGEARPDHGRPRRHRTTHRPLLETPSGPFLFRVGTFFVFAVCLGSLLALSFRRASRLPPSLSTYERGLVSERVSYKDVLQEAGRPWSNRTHRHLDSLVLAYVTPWNSKGYDFAKIYRDKFTHVSPVWYQLKRNGEELELLGKHDADLGWINDVRVKQKPLIVPRVMLEGHPLDTMLVRQEDRKLAISLILSECKKMNYDGIVLESWSAWSAYGILDNKTLRRKAVEFVRELGLVLHKSHLELILVIPPPGPQKMESTQFSPADMRFLGDAVDGFSLMTYDFSNAYRPGPLAPLFWVRACLQLLLPTGTSAGAASKLLMGVNFYGNDFILPQGGQPIVGHEYLSLLRKNRPEVIAWDDSSKEHFFKFSDGAANHQVFYPSLKSIDLRLKEAKRWGVGISIWEIGQGLDYFFDLL